MSFSQSSETMQHKTIIKHTLSTTAALQLCSVAVQHAETLGIDICITVVCPSGNVLASAAMNHAPSISFDVSRKKAITAASFKIPTKDWQTRLADKNNTLFALQSEPNFTFLGGGLPITIEGNLVGAIGISGGSELQDIDCATSAINSLF